MSLDSGPFLHQARKQIHMHTVKPIKTISHQAIIFSSLSKLTLSTANCV